ncbi:8-amino-7-oxononanoate synthase [Acaryochloris sp. CCMEE 5410]|uniref:8-amino-7-oxononanoate synthase n=1 Tax=Acaryochloris sp. CCMEE 5410 TaxID=310037 RepID=UPI0002485181|nr:8-amino-7-oxononanoate synthase [Acaryochloris sp. CCMEE 5410]KAI9134062.1 8-amino-7-oxononanoate synthase [Acaryochloris sp. CCMEE 5410]
MAAYAWIESALATVHKANWYRSVKTMSSPGPTAVLNGKTVINFASNDYLGLAGDSRLAEAAIAAIHTYGTGSTGSRLLSGHRLIHEQLEGAISSWKQTEAAIVYSSGYLANIGTITALVNKRDLILADAYNHASLKNGARLSGATLHEFGHAHVTELQTLLETHRAYHRRCLLVTDSVFSMDGDLCPLPELIDLAEQYDCMLLIDEAHGTGVLGATGAGCVEHFGCRDAELIQMGTLSKALGSLGGYVAGSANLIDYLRNRSSSWIYTTGLSPADTAAALAAVEIIREGSELRSQLWQRVTQLKQALTSQLASENDHQTMQLLPSESPIFCVQMLTPAAVLTASQQLLDQGIFAPAIRPPTVPTSRIRISMMATHQPEHVDQLIAAFSVMAHQ